MPSEPSELLLEGAVQFVQWLSGAFIEWLDWLYGSELAVVCLICFIHRTFQWWWRRWKWWWHWNWLCLFWWRRERENKKQQPFKGTMMKIMRTAVIAVMMIAVVMVVVMLIVVLIWSCSALQTWVGMALPEKSETYPGLTRRGIVAKERNQGNGQFRSPRWTRKALASVCVCRLVDQLFDWLVGWLIMKHPLPSPLRNKNKTSYIFTHVFLHSHLSSPRLFELHLNIYTYNIYIQVHDVFLLNISVFVELLSFASRLVPYSFFAEVFFQHYLLSPFPIFSENLTAIPGKAGSSSER